MSPAQRRFLIIDQTIGTAVVTGLINAAIGWSMFGGQSSVPLWGAQGMAADLLATGFLLPFLICVISTPLARRQIAAGKLSRLRLKRDDLGLLGKLPEKARRRGLVLGAIGLLVITPLAIAVLSALGQNPMPTGDFIGFKSLFAAAFSAVVGPLVGVWAILSDD